MSRLTLAGPQRRGTWYGARTGCTTGQMPTMEDEMCGETVSIDLLAGFPVSPGDQYVRTTLAMVGPSFGKTALGT